MIRLLRDPRGGLGFVIVAVLVLLGVLAAVIAPHDPLQIDAENALIWSEYYDRSWEEVLQASSLGQRRLIDGLQALSLNDLHDAGLTARLSW